MVWNDAANSLIQLARRSLSTLGTPWSGWRTAAIREGYSSSQTQPLHSIRRWSKRQDLLHFLGIQDCGYMAEQKTGLISFLACDRMAGVEVVYAASSTAPSH